MCFALEWRATLRGRGFEGALVFGEVSAQNEPSEYEVEVRVGASGPAEGSPEQMALVSLLGPLRCEAALEAGRLTQQIWLHLLAFREAFGELEHE